MRRWGQTNGLRQREVLGRFLKKEVKGMNRLNKIVAVVMALALLVTGAGYVVKAVPTQDSATSMAPVNTSALANQEKKVAERMFGEQFPAMKAQLAATMDAWLIEFIVGEGIEELYGREEQLDLKTREICTVATLTTLGKPEELKLHLVAAFNLGWTFDEIKEVMQLCILPAGCPAAIDALRFLYGFAQQSGIPIPPPKELPEGYYTTDWYEIGYAEGIQLFGKKNWKNYLKEISRLDPELADSMVKNYYGKIMTICNKIDDRTRELCYVEAFAALRDEKELKLHIQGALNSGATSSEIEELLFAVSGYAGMGATSQAIEVYKKVKK
jgi:4-carboxymuconolactone decarboxylase